MPVPLAATGGFQAAAAALPSAANIFSLVLQRRWARKDLERQNRYNSPAEQLKRLKEAGLPAAAFFSGGVSSQSDQPRSTEVSPDLGTSAFFDKFAMNQLQKKQLEIMDAEVREKRANASLKESEAQWLLTNRMSNQDPSFAPGTVHPRQHLLLQADMNMKDYQVRNIRITNEIEETVNKIKKLELDNRSDYDRNRMAQEVVKLVMQNDMMKQVIDTTRDKMVFMRAVSQGFQKDGIKGIEAILFNLMYGEGGVNALNLLK